MSRNEKMDRLAWQGQTPSPLAEKQSTDLSLRSLVAKLMRGEDLDRETASGMLDAILDGEATDAQIAATLVALAIKGETVEELIGMAMSMRSRAVHINSQHANFIDTAGTGSSRAKTFNVSTASAFVIAGAGLPVAKHGSRAATSLSGSADVLTALGVNVSAPPEVSERCLNRIGICFMFAPLFHGATARVADVRRQLGIQTTFNLLGPVTNPANAPRQILGAWHASLIEPLANVLVGLGTERAWVVHGADGLDEITLAGKTFVVEVINGSVNSFEIGPRDFGFEVESIDNFQGGDAEVNAEIIRTVLNGTRNDAARRLVVSNSAAALFVGGKAETLDKAARISESSIDTGAALRKLEELIRETTTPFFENAGRVSDR